VAEFLFNKVPKADLGLDDASIPYYVSRIASQEGLSFAYLLVSQLTASYESGAQNYYFNPVLRLAIKRGDLEYTLRFLERVRMGLHGPICAAVEYGQLEILRRLIDMGGDRSLLGWDYLIEQASVRGHPEILRLLIRVRGHRPEDYAIAIRSLPTVEMRVQIQEDP
jgi:hypothetical protein